MGKLKIQVLGKGLIPRGYGLAPRKDPFNADLTLIGTILNTSGLSINFLHPEDNRLIPLTKSNLKRIWDTYSNMEYKTEKSKEVNVNNVKPHVPENNRNITTSTDSIEISQDHTKTEEITKEPPHQEVINTSASPETETIKDDEKKNESMTIKPIIQNDNKESNSKKEERRQRR